MSRAVVAALIFGAAAGHAHVVSMSSGEIAISGTHARYELRMPLYEVAHVQAPERALLSHIRFGGAEMKSSACEAEPAKDTYFCTAEYTFAAPIERLDVECTFPAITVPNHVHLLRAQLDGKSDQAVFDANFDRATLRFRPPTAFETAISEGAAGVARALGGIVQVLLVAALALAARTRRELVGLATMFFVGEAAATILAAHASWQPAPRFVEAAMALSLAYLSVEVLLLPEAGARWAVAGVLGSFQGLYFYLFLQNTSFHARYVLGGAIAAQAVAISLLGLLLWQIRRVARVLRPVQVSAAGLLVFGMAWFFLRLRG